MRLRFALIVSALALATCVASSSQAAVSSWLSTVGTVGGGFAPGDPAINFDATGGANGSIYLWLRNDQRLQSVAYNLATTTPGIINFTGVTVYTPDLIIPPATDIGDRWNLPVGLGMISGDGQTITNFNAVNVDKSGLDPTTRSFDQLWDPVAMAALFAKIDFTAVANGTTNFMLSEGSTLIVENSVQPPLTFGTGSIVVCGIGGVELPNIAVLGNANPINDGSTPSLLNDTDFGAVAQGSLQTRTFTINNTGTAELTLSGLNISAPFSLVGAFPGAIAASGSEVFTVGLDTSTLGPKTGSVSFTTNVAGLESFNFDLAAEVVPEPASLALVGLAMVGFVGLIRRRS
jgi:hypothetical protein